MSERFDRRLAYQPDIYQRYGLLAGLTQALLDDRSGPLTALDVGCGPVRLTETFLSGRFTVVRADVSQFGDSDIVEIRPGEPLPFETGSFDLTLGLEVIEHLPPPARPGLIRELQRVARLATIVSCPVATPETISAERDFARWAEAVSGREIEFLAEHQQYGLPDASDVSSWFASPPGVLVVDNAPLDDWQLFNLLDYIMAADLGEGEDKQRLNAMLNARSRFAREGAAHYRRFFAAFASGPAAAAAARFAGQMREPGGTNTSQRVREYATGILALRQGLRSRFAAELSAKEARIGQLDQHISGLSDGVADLRNSVGQKDEQISALEAHTRTLDTEIARLAGTVNELQDSLSAKAADMARLETEAEARVAEIGDLRGRLAAAEQRLTSRSRHLTEPLRAVGLEARRIVRAIRVSAAAGQSARVWSAEGWQRRRAYRVIARSGLFDAAWYRARYPDVAAAGVDPLAHYLASGAREGRDPHPDFETSYYLRSNPDVAGANLNPLLHFVLHGRREGRLPHARLTAGAVARSYVPPHGLLPWFNPLNVAVSPPLSNEPRLNVLVPALGMRNLSGGPNTALVLAGRLAAAGIRVRLISTDLPPDEDPAPFWRHLRNLLGTELPPGLELVDGHYRSTPLAIGEHDIFLATAWWTAQQAKYAVRHTAHQRFVYLIQDYEALFHAASTSQALAEETYTLDHIPVINSSWLYEFLVARQVGRFADERFSRNALVFQPAVDRRVFYPRERADVDGRRRILFYARPTGGLRNLFELGVAALQKAVEDGVLKADEWEFVGMGEQFAPVPLGGGAMLVPAPWLDLSGYARQMRESDILLSLMLSPHPSYPPLEMAASGGLVVTTSYQGKSAGQLANLSANIVATEPTLEAITQGLVTARSRLPNWAARIEAARVNLPQTWSESLEDVVPALAARLLEQQGSPRLSPAASLSTAGNVTSIHPMFRGWPKHAYDVYRRQALRRRRDQYPALDRPGLLSFVTPVWNTDPRQLEELAESVLDQDLPLNYEWIVLDNGSDRRETKEALNRLAGHPVVRLHRSDRNLGIIAGTRFCLEQASGRYVATVDHDDLLAPDCVRVLTYALVSAGYPDLAYTDEDKVDGETYREPYFKPDWDPVLFAASCYIAHLIVFDRQRALALGAYTDTAAEGSHDWDTFMRFTLAQSVPAHIPEVLYTWRMHALSTAGNIQSKPYVAASHQCVLQKFVATSPRPERYRIEESPLFDGTPDWWVRRQRVDARAITTVLIGAGNADSANPKLDTAIPHEVISLQADAGIAAFEPIVRRCAEAQRLVHLLWAGTDIDGTEWPWEAMAQFELFPDTAVVGGRVHSDGRILSAASYFGFGRGCDSPDRGRAITDPGYFAQMWKPRSASAVPVQHCVVHPVFFKEFLARYGHADFPMRHLAAWLGAFARSREQRVIYTPFLSARSDEDLEGHADAAEWAAFRAVHRAVIPETRYLSPRLGLDASTAYLPVTTETRRDQLDAHGLTDGAQVLAADRIARRALYPVVPANTGFSVLTSVYERTPARLLELTSESLLRQRRPFDEWVLLVNGPVPDDVEQVLTRLASDPRIRLSRVSVNLGIVGAMRRCLEASTAEYVVPVDADDLLEEDALEVLEAALARTAADFAYSDEDILSDDGALARYSRPAFDPVLNLETSYIWHLCAFRRERALELGVYSDRGAEFCHDWDTVLRFTAARASITHIPHVLYRWRTHAASQSHSGVQNKGSVASTRHVLQQVVSQQARPDLYEVRPYPLYRGAEEWYAARRADEPPAIDVLILSCGPEDATPHVFESLTFPFRRIVRIPMSGGWPVALAEMLSAVDATSSHVVVVSDRICLRGDDWVWEAVRLFELHADVAVVSGRVHDSQDVVIDTGRRLGSWSQGYKDFTGLRRSDPGPFALALKPHSIDVPVAVPIVVDTSFLCSALAPTEGGAPQPLPQLLATAAARHSRRMVYSPLIDATQSSSAQPLESSKGESQRAGDCILSHG